MKSGRITVVTGIILAGEADPEIPDSLIVTFNKLSGKFLYIHLIFDYLVHICFKDFPVCMVY